MPRAPVAVAKVLLCKFYYKYIIKMCIPGKIIYQGFTICSILDVKMFGRTLKNLLFSCLKRLQNIKTPLPDKKRQFFVLCNR